MKKFICLSILFLIPSFFGVGMRAQNVLSADDVTIEPGASVSVSVSFTNTTSGICSFVYTAVLPEWLSITNATFNKERTDDTSPSFAISLAEGTTDTYIFWYNSSDSEVFSITGNSGELFTFRFVASAEAPIGETAKISFTPQECYDLDLNNVELTLNPINITVGSAATETVTIPLANEWNTYCSGNALDFEGVAGVKAYVVSSVTATQAITTQVTQVPAGEGFLIQKTVADVTSIEVPVIASAAAVTNKLVGVTEETLITAGNYVLSDGKFLPCNEGTLPANKAYLPQDAVPTSAGAKGITIVFDGNTTGINEIQKAETDGAIYNLSGMRVSKTQKGVYIMNGRKVIVK